MSGGSGTKGSHWEQALFAVRGGAAGMHSCSYSLREGRP